MVNYEGAIDYIILKDKSRYIIFFLDNHNPSHYCPIPAENIDSLFKEFNQNKNLFLFEELINQTQFIPIFPKTKHLIKYLKFYNENMNNDNVISVDIRIDFDNTEHESTNIFKNLDILFNMSIDSNNNINAIKKHIYEICQKSEIFNQHFLRLKNYYINIKNSVIEKNLVDILKKNNGSSNDNIYLNFPWMIESEFEIISENNILNIWELLYSSLLELYTISWIEYSTSKYIIVYLGASHCLSIYNLLHKYYNYRNIKNFKEINLRTLNKLNLEILDNFDKSCINFDIKKL